MPLSLEHSIAEEVVTALNVEDFSIAFTAERKHIELLDTPAIATLRVVVAPSGKNSEQVARNVWEESPSVGIAIRKKLIAGDESSASTELDGLTYLAEQIERFARSLAVTGATLESYERQPIADPEKLTQREYLAIIQLQYKSDIED